MGKQVCGVKLMSPGGREVAPSGDEREDAEPGLLTLAQWCPLHGGVLCMVHCGRVSA